MDFNGTWSGDLLQSSGLQINSMKQLMKNGEQNFQDVDDTGKRQTAYTNMKRKITDAKVKNSSGTEINITGSDWKVKEWSPKEDSRQNVMYSKEELGHSGDTYGPKKRTFADTEFKQTWDGTSGTLNSDTEIFNVTERKPEWTKTRKEDGTAIKNHDGSTDDNTKFEHENVKKKVGEHLMDNSTGF